MDYLKIYLLSICILSFSTFAFADDSSLSKENYTLFNPTPREQMREFSTDRPDKMESSYTVDAGHFQHETDLVNLSFNNDRGDRESAALVMAPNLKVGINNRIDLQLVVESFNYNTQKVDGSRTKRSGFGDLTTRLKVNIIGNDEGDVALAIMPYLKFPTNQGELGNNSVEGGVIAPLTISISETTSLGLMGQIDIVRDDRGDGYVGELVYITNVGQSLTDDFGGYLEFWSSVSPLRGVSSTVDIGLFYEVVEDTQLDLGVNVGMTEAADDLNPFIGISQRF